MRIVITIETHGPDHDDDPMHVTMMLESNMQFTCKQCGKPFRSERRTATYCSRACCHAGISHPRGPLYDTHVRAYRRNLRRRLAAPYPFCRHPDKCSGAGYCRFDPACND